MSRRRAVSFLMSLLAAASVVGVGLVATSGVSQAAKLAKGPMPYYLSLGDSYSIGYQPTAPGGGGTPGYTAYVAGKLKMNLQNFGCGGATTSSILTSPGCSDPAATNAVPYSTTQEQAALTFIETPANAGLVKLVTVSIGGNDITGCVSAGTTSAITTCVLDNAATAKTNIETLVGDLRTALDANGDTNARIIGLTYPDVILGQYVNPGGSSAISLAQLSVTAFDDIVNPDFAAAYASVANSGFVNVTTAHYKKAKEGDDTPLTDTTPLAPYGKIPRAVWEICTITYYCQLQNIHANTLGYDFIGKLVTATYKAG